MIDLAQEELIYEEAVKVIVDDDNNSEGNANGDQHPIETELETLNARLKEMQDEAEKIRHIQSEVDKQMKIPSEAEPAAFPTIFT